MAEKIFVLPAVLAVFAAGSFGYVYEPNDFAVEVVDYVPGSGIATFPYTGQLYDNPLAALGRPTIDTIGDGSAAAPGQMVPVVPVYPAWQPEEVVCIGFRGHLTLRLGRRVYDEPDNPFGKDLIVFGNSFQNLSGFEYWLSGDPSLVLTKNKACTREPAAVSVSQDGENWFTFTMDETYRVNPDFADANFPGRYGFLGDFFADGFAPTLGRVYKPNSSGWWGEPTDPTLPLDPAVLETDLRNTTLAQIALRYGKSAGGTALDISWFDLPTDPQTGRKWIQYIRFDNPRNSGATPEIDAVARVRSRKETSLAADIAGDGRVDLNDLAELSRFWMMPDGTGPEDE
jgi:hypothetical protein